ncbi:hypothetical protein ACFFJT_01030 [Dyella flava]|uniref:Uncharacterized protein n=1 Tax=Dyella flava TaxID=1920170 RepID=A0ABS2K1I0_9GAMM|nr:hypothetical protein [Dyella flava]MBM7124974.1 hypothetical protein [Dyella flava]
MLANSAGGFPAMVGNVPFLMKGLVLRAVLMYPLKEDVVGALACEADRA